MNAIDAADEAEWNRVQSVLDLRAQNQYMDNKMARVDNVGGEESMDRAGVEI
ncbi:MAG: hypothetical protein IT310_03015 [Anaerolineales bacterium]|nr:hypothetical protein [Anaerolineales bacterium]